ncbi:hypothetical protein ACK3SF_01995 [Candidatus Nanosalina sp. VS9-1]|uniref:hypothetical protein n=1 Tax=Candidatus Nanosalina sp. VS9-1 TaxID=3388566 RepID=UPI0039E1B616
MGAHSVSRDGEGNYVSEYRDSLNLLDPPIKNLMRGNIFPPKAHEKVQSEVEADQKLTEKYISHHEVLDYSEEDGVVVTEEIEDAVLVKKYLEEADIHEVSDIGESMGHLIADIHRFGTHGDPGLGNFMYRDGEIFSIDHEFYSNNATAADIADDIRIIEADSRNMAPEKYEAFIENFREGYRTELEASGIENVDRKNSAELSVLNEPLVIFDGLGRTLDGSGKNYQQKFDEALNLMYNSLKQ